MLCVHACMHAQLLQSCQNLCDPMDCSLLGSFVHVISGQLYWSELLCPLPGNLLIQGLSQNFLCRMHCRQIHYC